MRHQHCLEIKVTQAHAIIKGDFFLNHYLMMLSRAAKADQGALYGVNCCRRFELLSPTGF